MTSIDIQSIVCLLAVAQIQALTLRLFKLKNEVMLYRLWFPTLVIIQSLAVLKIGLYVGSKYVVPTAVVR